MCVVKGIYLFKPLKLFSINKKKVCKCNKAYIYLYEDLRNRILKCSNARCDAADDGKNMEDETFNYFIFTNKSN